MGAIAIGSDTSAGTHSCSSAIVPALVAVDQVLSAPSKRRDSPISDQAGRLPVEIVPGKGTQPHRAKTWPTSHQQPGRPTHGDRLNPSTNHRPWSASPRLFGTRVDLSPQHPSPEPARVAKEDETSCILGSFTNSERIHKR